MRLKRLQIVLVQVPTVHYVNAFMKFTASKLKKDPVGSAFYWNEVKIQENEKTATKVETFVSISQIYPSYSAFN